MRYADDFVILCRSEAEAQAALGQVRAWVKEAGLTLHPEKTRIVNASAPGGFDFLGYHFERGMKWPRSEEPEEAEGTDPGEDLTARRAEPEGNRGGREPNLAGLVWILPAQQGEHV